MARQQVDLVWKLLRAGISVPQITGYALAGLLGLTIVMVAVQFYTDMRDVLSGDDDGLGHDYLVVTKTVTTAGALLGADGRFSDNELADLRSQPWCRDVGTFRASDFSISARIALGNTGHGLRTGFFFESVNERYLDVDPAVWSFDSVTRVVPVIIPRDYLSLYNFGFAAAHGLPRISYGQVSMVPLQFTIAGHGEETEMEGRIVGFSGRLNTIVVPESFMDWASRRYGDGRSTGPSRLILEVTSPGDLALGEYVKTHHLEVAGDKMNGNRASQLLLVVSSVVVAVGTVICVLAFALLVLSIFLLVARNATQVRHLIQLGYTPSMVARPYRRLIVWLSVTELAVATALTLAVRAGYASVISSAMGTGTTAIPWVGVTAGVAVATLLTVVNLRAVGHRINSLT